MKFKSIVFRESSGKIFGNHKNQPKYMYLDKGKYFDFTTKKVVELHKTTLLHSYGHRLYHQEYIDTFKDIEKNFKMDETSKEKYLKIIKYLELPNKGIDTFREDKPLLTDDSFGSFRYFSGVEFYLVLNSNEVISIAPAKKKIFIMNDTFNSSTIHKIDSDKIKDNIELIEEALIKISKDFLFTTKSSIILNKLILIANRIKEEKESEKKVEKEEANKKAEIKKDKKEIKENKEKLYFNNGFVYNEYFSVKLSHISSLEYKNKEIHINSYGIIYSYLADKELFSKIKDTFMNPTTNTF